MPVVVALDASDRTRIADVGGKGANLGELVGFGVDVPPGFCVTTEATDPLVVGVATPSPDDPAFDERCAAIRAAIEQATLPDVTAIQAAVARIGAPAYAVRSSATAEDLPTASFAGMHDSFLDVAPDAVPDAVRRCVASLFTARAVAYRARHGFDGVRMAVVVQAMVPAEAAGVLFTADPVTGNRRVSVVEAVRGLGDALVSGRVTPDTFHVRGDAVRGAGALSTTDVLRLVALGRRIEAHFGRPQDIEWCLAEGAIHVVQSRPITTLFPIPAAPDDAPRVYLSVGHQQMMTDALRPLGLSVWQHAALRPMADAGGRPFVDVTAALATPAGQAGLLGMAGRNDPLTRDALQTLLDRAFVPIVDAGPPPTPPAPPPPLEPDPELVPGLIEKANASITAFEAAIEDRTGAELLDAVLADFAELERVLADPVSTRVVMSGFEAAWWLDAQLGTWLGEAGAADVLAQSVPHNVTSQMGLGLLDVADAVRADPQAVAALERGDPLPEPARSALDAWLAVYGVRCVGEIDVTRPRWREEPAALVPLLLGHVRAFGPGEAARRFSRGRAQAEAKAAEILARLAELPDGADKVAQTRSRIERLRAFAGYREYPKYALVCRFAVYRRALLAEAGRLAAAGVLARPDDAWFLTLPELAEVARTGVADAALIRERRASFAAFEALTPPRVLTSEGEAVTGAYRRADVPEGALVGLAVSSGTIEGRARVVRRLADARLEPGDVLVTPFTDPSWTPVFVGIAGLVTEVGGLMTHGSVIARELGLPAVVGVLDATRRIRDGQRIRVDGTAGWVELLD